MLRREAEDCLIGKVIDEDAVIDEAMRGEHRLFATLMVVMAGVACWHVVPADQHFGQFSGH